MSGGVDMRRREFRKIVWEALVEAMPFQVPVTALLADDMTRALKKRLMERFDNGIPIFFRGQKALVLKTSKEERRMKRRV